MIESTIMTTHFGFAHLISTMSLQKKNPVARQYATSIPEESKKVRALLRRSNDKGEGLCRIFAAICNELRLKKMVMPLIVV
ncbi:hypothetical protein [Candidatus Manganitrophus noduliformans]|uniref:hypothetical protein n=1 Tax=Candidatus Manganitrophus noduliformans TaxID=2606439 RepID=UPI00143A30F7|nr:hypothetical protein [Candidatus Manganitrophus noduliformans]